jgi:hypothetical protein
MINYAKETFDDESTSNKTVSIRELMNGVMATEDAMEQREETPAPHAKYVPYLKPAKKRTATPVEQTTDAPLPVANDLVSQAKARLSALVQRRDQATGDTVYLERDSERAVLRDTGSKICVTEDKPSDEDILLMLVAAQEKFGDKFKVFGTDEFVERCSRIALMHDIKMQNTQRETTSRSPKVS